MTATAAAVAARRWRRRWRPGNEDFWKLEPSRRTAGIAFAENTDGGGGQGEARVGVGRGGSRGHEDG